MPDFKKMLEDGQDQRQKEQETLDKIRLKHKTTNLKEVRNFEDEIAFGIADLSYPGKVVISETGRTLVFSAHDVGNEARQHLLAAKNQKVALLHDGDRRLAKTLSVDYDRLDAMDDFIVGLQKHHHADPLWARHLPEQYVLDIRGEVSTSYKELQANVGHVSNRAPEEAIAASAMAMMHAKAKEDAVAILERDGRMAHEIWPLISSGRGEILSAWFLDHGQTKDGVIAVGFGDGVYQIQYHPDLTTLIEGTFIDFAMNDQKTDYASYSSDRETYWLTRDTDREWLVHHTPDTKGQNYGPFESLSQAWEILDQDRIEEHDYTLTEEDLERAYPLVRNPLRVLSVPGRNATMTTEQYYERMNAETEKHEREAVGRSR